MPRWSTACNDQATPDRSPPKPHSAPAYGGGFVVPRPRSGSRGNGRAAGGEAGRSATQREAVTMTRMRVCAQPGCPALGTTTRCTEHTRAADKARGSRQARGYDAQHERLRRQWAPEVAAGTVTCARGGHLIDPSKPWALDHTDDRTGYLGPSCATCNNSAGGKAAHQT